MSRLLLLLALFMVTCSNTEMEDNETHGADPKSNRVLIIYLTRTGNTKAVGEIIHHRIGGTLVELELEKPYPKDYRTHVEQVVQENASGFLPPLKTKVDMTQFDIVYIGFPTWGMQLPPPIKSFLHQYDLKGKTVIPFNTNAGYGIGSSFDTIKSLCINSTILEGFSIQGGIERDGILFVMEGEKAQQAEAAIRKWLQKLGQLK